MLLEYLPSRDLYTSKILDQEQPPVNMTCPGCQSRQGLLRCKNCLSRDLLCRNCCLMVHRNTPFHSVEKWTGRFFQPTSLNEEGFTLYLGHGGAPCPESGTQETKASDTAHEEAADEEASLEGWQDDTRKCLIVVDISGVHQLHIGWCHCKGTPGADVQLLNSCLFPATISNPSTAFTFGLLDYFHIDSVECKTSAMSFFSKLRRLTNNSSPDSVPVCYLVPHPSIDFSDCAHRTDTGN